MKFRLSPYVTTVTIGLWLVCILIPDCNKSNNKGNTNLDTATSTITDILKSSANSSYFYYAMKRTHLDSMFSSTEMFQVFTVFVPTDSAFEAAGITKSILMASTDSALKRIVLYLTLNRKLLSSYIPTPDYRFTTADGESAYFTNNPHGFFINGIPVSRGDIVVKNGVLQFIWNTVPLPPAGSLMQILQSDTSFAFLIAAFNRATYHPIGLVPGGFGQMLSSLNPYTFFAPTNHAFQINGYPDTATINAAIQDSLGFILLGHMLPGFTFACDLSDGQRIYTIYADTIVVSISGASLKVAGHSNNVPANILKTNIIATNGVIYSIDQVLKH